MMSKHIYLIKAGYTNKLISILTSQYKLPTIDSSMAMYAEYKNKTIEIKFFNTSCFLRSYDKSSTIDKQFLDSFNSTPPIKIDNKNIKYFLRIVYGLGFTEAYITDEVTQLSYSFGKTNLRLLLGTPIGDLIVTNNKLLPDIYKLVANVLQEREIDELFAKESAKESLFDSGMVLNRKIVNYCDKFGLDIIPCENINIQSRLNNKSNDYSYFSILYNKILHSELGTRKSTDRLKKNLFKPLSIIICAYNSDDTLIKTLYSIQSQELSIQQKRMLDVIVVDDGSNHPVRTIVAPYIESFDFHLNIIRFEQNHGLSNARNTGANNAIYDKLLFIDSDILLAANYILEHSTALQLFPHAVFVSMKQNVDGIAQEYNLENIRLGLCPPKDYDDKRIVRIFYKKQKWIHEVPTSGIFEVLGDTDLFKNFGHGRIINGYDLPSMVTGHNLSISKNLFLQSGGFARNFKGWGLEDTYFGAQIISNGGFIIPLINTGVYHINHLPRSGSEQQKLKEFQSNLIVYNELIKDSNGKL